MDNNNTPMKVAASMGEVKGNYRFMDYSWDNYSWGFPIGTRIHHPRMRSLTDGRTIGPASTRAMASPMPSL